MKKNEGITLLALVITIIIIIILSTITIKFAFGDNGLTNKAEEARDLMSNDMEYEQGVMQNAADYMNQYMEDLNNGSEEEQPEQKEKSELLLKIPSIVLEFNPSYTTQIEAEIIKGDGKIVYEVRQSSNVISVSEDGIVSVLGVGSAEILVRVSETENYAASDPVSIQVTILPTPVDPNLNSTPVPPVT